jgi:hypothetical protein
MLRFDIYISATKYGKKVLLGTTIARTATAAIDKLCKQLSYLEVPKDVHFDALVVI